MDALGSVPTARRGQLKYCAALKMLSMAENER